MGRGNGDLKRGGRGAGEAGEAGEEEIFLLSFPLPKKGGAKGKGKKGKGRSYLKSTVFV